MNFQTDIWDNFLEGLKVYFKPSRIIDYKNLIVFDKHIRLIQIYLHEPKKSKDIPRSIIVYINFKSEMSMHYFSLKREFIAEHYDLPLSYDIPNNQLDRKNIRNVEGLIKTSFPGFEHLNMKTAYEKAQGLGISLHDFKYDYFYTLV